MEWRSLKTAAGVVDLAYTANGLSKLCLPAGDEAKFHTITETDPPWLQRLKDELESYFAGIPVSFSCPIDTTGYPPFFARVLACTAAIPYGERLTYRELAAAAGSPLAARAAGQALAANRTPVVIPCHRVVGSGGALGGYSGGLEWKSELLALEQAANAIEEKQSRDRPDRRRT